MAKAHWKEISALNKVVAGNDTDPIHRFIDILAKNGLLIEFTMEALCEATHNGEAYDLLHEFANKHMNDG